MRILPSKNRIIQNNNHHHHDFLLLLLLLLLGMLILSSITTTEAASASVHCNQSCNGLAHNRLPYPFGFSDGCPIRLNCSRSTGEIFIGEFQLQNVTSDNILINIPPNCTRSINSLIPLFHPNYALTWENALLLQNCSSPLNGCVIPSVLMENQFDDLQGWCSSTSNRSHRPYCYSNGENKTAGRFMSYANVTQSGCHLFFSSIAVALNHSSLVSLEFRTVQLGWWLEGNACNCSPYANCTKIVSPFNGRPGFRCRCMEGYIGDGFLAGSGCSKVSSRCNTSRYLSGNCGGTRIDFLIGGVIAGASLMTALAFLCYIIRRQSTCLRFRNRTKQLLSEATGSYNVPFYTYKEMERATCGFSDKYKLGNGAYGTVYSGKLHSDEWVAIKKIRYRDGESIEQVMNEIKLISSVNHPNLIRLLGCCLEKGEQILVYEFMPNGTLCQHLQRERGTGLPWTIRLTVASETAQAIAHLHFGMNPPIYHRDIKSSNILLDFNFSSKVADFGLSRLGLAEFSHISTAPQGTPGYLDPQYHQNFHLSDKSDVYSFGVVLIEIVTAMKVVDFSRPQNEVNLAAFAIEKIGNGCVDEIIDPFLEPHRDAWTLSSIHKVCELAFRCLAFHSEARPSMMEVAAELEHIRFSGGCTPLDPLGENICFDSSPDLCRSSPSNGNDELHSVTVKKLEVEKPKLVMPQLGNYVLSEVKDLSPVSVQEVWSFSEESSPSTNSLLYRSNIVSLKHPKN